jgi:hypothetical protein
VVYGQVAGGANAGNSRTNDQDVAVRATLETGALGAGTCRAHPETFHVYSTTSMRDGGLRQPPGPTVKSTPNNS